MEIADIYGQCFRYSGAGAAEEQQQRPIAAAARCPLIWRCNQRVQFFAREVMGHLRVRPLEWDSQDPMGDTERPRVVGSDVLEEGSHRRQPRIARLDLIRARGFQMIEEGENGVAIDMVDGEIAWFAPCSIGGEQHQHAKGVSIACDRCQRGIALPGHAMAEEGLQQRWKGRASAHDGSPQVKDRSAAIASSSAPAVT
jgi:hypothetical protein